MRHPYIHIFYQKGDGRRCAASPLLYFLLKRSEGAAVRHPYIHIFIKKVRESLL
jgi:hypothetical protein